jgi:hypothetical protein
MEHPGSHGQFMTGMNADDCNRVRECGFLYRCQTQLLPMSAFRASRCIEWDFSDIGRFQEDVPTQRRLSREY